MNQAQSIYSSRTPAETRSLYAHRHSAVDADVSNLVTTTAAPPAPWHSMVNVPSRVSNGAVLSTINSNGKAITRKTAVGDMVDAYRNLNKPEYFSCKQRSGADKGKVSCYAKVLILEDVTFCVSEASRQRTLRQKSRNVHAFCRSRFKDCYDGDFAPPSDWACVTYNPYKSDFFYYRETGETLDKDMTFRFAVLHGSNVYLPP